MRTRVETHRKQYEAMLGWSKNYLGKLTDADLKRPVAPGCNHGVWTLAHIVTSDDELGLFIGKQPLLFPNYLKEFGMRSAPKPVEECPQPALLREQWLETIKKVRGIYDSLKDENLDEEHDNMQGNEEDEWFKTKESVLIHWNLHQQYHVGHFGVLLKQLGKNWI